MLRDEGGVLDLSISSHHVALAPIALGHEFNQFIASHKFSLLVQHRGYAHAYKIEISSLLTVF